MMNIQSTAEDGQIISIILPRNILRNHLFITKPRSPKTVFFAMLPNRKQTGII